MLNYQKGDIITLKKPHACGTNEWEIFQTGIDIKLKCQSCDRLVILPRREFERRVRRVKIEDGSFVAIINRK